MYVHNWEYLTEEEQVLVEWQYNMNGGFFTALWEAIGCADMGNLARLERAFPIHVKAYRRFVGEEGFWLTVLKKIESPKEAADG